MKHSGLAAELHVVHWSFLVDTEGEEGESRERPIPEPSISQGEPSPSSPSRCASCARLPGDAGTQAHIPWPAGSSSAPRVAQMCVCSWQRGKGQACSFPPSCTQLTKPSHAGTVARSQTAPLPCPLPPPISKEQNKPHLSGLFMVNIGKTLTNVTNAKEREVLA